VGGPIEVLMSERFRSVHPAHRNGYSSQPRMRPMGTGMELFGKRRDGSEFPVDIMLSPVETAEGRFVLSVIRDITERKRLEQEMQRLLSESQRVARIGSWNLEIASNKLRWSAETYRIYGVTPDSFHPSPESLLGLIHSEDRPLMQEWIRACVAGEHPHDLEFRSVLQDASIRILHGRGDLEHSPDGTPVRIMGTVQDVTRHRQREEELIRESILDPLTGLYNRRFCEQALAREISRASRSGNPLVVVCLDLDGLKQTNDRLGHAVGDHVIKEFARRLQKAVRGSDFAVRMGGDEFLVVLLECPSEKVQLVLNRIRDFEVEYEGTKIGVSSSYGWARYNLGDTSDELIRRADMELYANKRARGISSPGVAESIQGESSSN